MSSSIRLTVFALAVVEHHLGAEGCRPFAVRPRRIAGHDDGGRHAEELCRRGDTLSVIAGRKRHHAAGALVERERGKLVVGAAKLEGAGPLQGFRLQKHAAAGAGVEDGR